MANSTAWFVLWLPLLMALAAGALYLLLRPETRGAERREQRMAELAARLGMRYLGTLESDATASLPRCWLLERAMPCRLAHAMVDKPRDPALLLFELQSRPTWREGSAESGEAHLAYTYLVAMARLKPPGLQATVRVFFEDLLGGPAGLDGFYRAGPSDGSGFRERCFVWGEPREAVQSALTLPVRRAITAWARRGPRPVVELASGWLAVWRESQPSDRRVAEDAASLATYASSIARAFASERAAG